MKVRGEYKCHYSKAHGLSSFFPMGMSMHFPLAYIGYLKKTSLGSHKKTSFNYSRRRLENRDRFFFEAVWFLPTLFCHILLDFQCCISCAYKKVKSLLILFIYLFLCVCVIITLTFNSPVRSCTISLYLTKS